LNGVTFQEGNYYVVGSQGVVLRSSDAANWTTLTPWTSKSLYDIGGENGQLLTVGIEGAALRSRIIPWTNSVNFLGLTLSTNTQAFLFSGHPDQRFIIQRSPDFGSWVDFAPAEIRDTTGASIFYDALLGGLQWFFRTRVLDP
jgi:hypothetical protein